MKHFLFILCFLPALGWTQEYRDIYLSQFASKATGVYQHGNQLYFVVKQACLSEKKYAGTEESKKAEISFYEMLQAEAIKRAWMFDINSIPYQGQLQRDIYARVVAKYDVNAFVQHQLIFDRAIDGCVREYVKTVLVPQKVGNQIAISAKILAPIVGELFVAAQADNELLIEYTANAGLLELAALLREANSVRSYPINLALSDDASRFSAYCDHNQYCFQTLSPDSKFDFNRVIAKVLASNGVINLWASHTNKALAEDFYQAARVNFDQGRLPEQIIRDLTMALNLNPFMAESWKLLSNIYRATEQHQKANAIINQYLVQHPHDYEAWVVLMKTLEPLNPEQAQQLNKLLRALANSYSYSDWALKQIRI